MSNTSSQLLKGEINTALGRLHDFAKWKVVLISTLVATALGLSSSQGQSEHYWLLFLVPYACAYVDLHGYQYMNRILVLSKYLRTVSAEVDTGDTVLQGYEEYCYRLRNKTAYTAHVFDLGEWTNLGSSVVVSIISPLYAINRVDHSSFPLLLSPWIIWVCGGIFVVGTFVWHLVSRRKLESEPIPR